jgi:hypothetical protein
MSGESKGEAPAKRKVPIEEQMRAVFAARNMVEKRYDEHLYQKRPGITEEGKTRHLEALDAASKTMHWITENEDDFRALAREIAARKKAA